MSASLQPSTPATVHLVDDDRDVAEALRFALQVEGVPVLLYDSAEALLGSQTLPDRGCLVVDQYMPGMTGLELTRVLRTRGFASPIVLITGRSDAGLRRRAASAGVDRVLEKPLSGGVFVDVVKAALQADPLDRP